MDPGEALGAAVTSIKTTLKARYGVTRPSTKTTSFDLARIYYWAAAIRRVRAAYMSAHNGRKPRAATASLYGDDAVAQAV